MHRAYTVFEVYDFLVIFRDSFRFILGSFFGGILARFWINFWSFWVQKDAKISTKIDAKMGIEKVGSEEARALPRIPGWCQGGE